MPTKKVIETQQPSVPSQKQYVPFIVVIILVAAIFAAFFFLDFRSGNKNAPEQPLPISPASSASTGGAPQNQPFPALGQQVDITKSTGPEITDVANKVAKHVVLPSGNVTVFIVSDKEALLRENPQLTFVKKGDYVLVYPDRAIFYDAIADLVQDIQHFAQK